MSTVGEPYFVCCVFEQYSPLTLTCISVVAGKHLGDNFKDYDDSATGL